ncbi:extensin family protein [Sphingomonas qilianensis]|uniref:Extensin family protein n=2 Tax=Sphingomonas qilianensis TaxID=1736690 RepID=A0ABU9XP54_9SPHN
MSFAGLAVFALSRGRPQDLPWAPLDLSQPAGLFTGRKIAALGDDIAACGAQLNRAGVRHTVLPAVRDGQCGYANAVRLSPGGARQVALAPTAVGLSCPVAAGLSLWEWDVVQPAARRYFGQRVASLDHYGSYSCRRIYGRNTGDLSEHASANALDVAGFRLEDGTRITVLGDWKDTGDKGKFLRAVRTGACNVFATVLSPDYNAAHRDHLHLDQADRGTAGWRACR